MSDPAPAPAPTPAYASACDSGLCGADVPPLIGTSLTGTGLTLDRAAALVLADEPLPRQLTDLQRRLVHERALHLQ